MLLLITDKFIVSYVHISYQISFIQFLPENFTIILFHYDGNVDGWWDLEWSKRAIHIVGFNQTKW